MKESDNTLLRIGLNIRRQRHGRHITQADLAQRMGCSAQHICDIEHGRVDVPVGTLLRFTRELHCGMKDLLLGL